MENISSSSKLALIARGGGMKCCWGAGVFHALALLGVTPDIIIAISGNAGNATYFKSGQHNVLKEIWVEHLASKRFIDPWRYPKIIDIEFLVNEVLQGRFPLDREAFHDSTSKLIIPSTSLITGQPVWFDDWQRYEIFEVLHVAKAMAVGYGKTLEIEGVPYVDVPSSHLMKLAIREATQRGATHFLLLDRLGSRGFVSNLIINYWLSKQSQKFQRGFANSAVEAGSVIEPKNIFRLYPDKSVSLFTRDAKKLDAIFEQGVQETKENYNLRNFLEGCQL